MTKIRLLFAIGMMTLLAWVGAAHTMSLELDDALVNEDSLPETAVLATISSEMKTWYPLTPQLYRARDR